MSSEETPPSSEAEVQVELQALLRGAYSNGVEIEGGFECRNGSEYPDWEVVVTEVEKKDRSQ